MRLLGAHEGRRGAGHIVSPRAQLVLGATCRSSRVQALCNVVTDRATGADNDHDDDEDDYDDDAVIMCRPRAQATWGVEESEWWSFAFMLHPDSANSQRCCCRIINKTAHAALHRYGYLTH